MDRVATRPLLALAPSLCAAAAVALVLLLPPRGAAAGGGGGGACGEVQCGMGTCSESSDYQFGFACQCSAGWSRYHVGAMQFPFLPCVIPNCTINYSCNDDGPSSPPPAPSPPTPPPPPPPPPTNLSVFDPCLMQYCGDGGACEKASRLHPPLRLPRWLRQPPQRHLLPVLTTVQVTDDRTAVLQLHAASPIRSKPDNTSFVRPCSAGSLGSDCKGLGIGVVNGSSPSSSPPTPISLTTNKSDAGATAAQADGLLGLLLLLLITFSALQAT